MSRQDKADSLWGGQSGGRGMQGGAKLLDTDSPERGKQTSGWSLYSFQWMPEKSLILTAAYGKSLECVEPPPSAASVLSSNSARFTRAQ